MSSLRTPTSLRVPATDASLRPPTSLRVPATDASLRPPTCAAASVFATPASRTVPLVGSAMRPAVPAMSPDLPAIDGSTRPVLPALSPSLVPMVGSATRPTMAPAPVSPDLEVGVATLDSEPRVVPVLPVASGFVVSEPLCAAAVPKSVVRLVGCPFASLDLGALASVLVVPFGAMASVNGLTAGVPSPDFPVPTSAGFPTTGTFPPSPGLPLIASGLPTGATEPTVPSPLGALGPAVGTSTLTCPFESTLGGFAMFSSAVRVLLMPCSPSFVAAVPPSGLVAGVSIPRVGVSDGFAGTACEPGASFLSQFCASTCLVSACLTGAVRVPFLRPANKSAPPPAGFPSATGRASTNGLASICDAPGETGATEPMGATGAMGDFSDERLFVSVEFCLSGASAI